jgi:hypothetical protein
MSLPAERPGKNQPGKPKKRSIRRPKTGAAKAAPPVASAPSTSRKGFRGVYFAHVSTRAARLLFLAGGVLLWAICGLAFSRAFFLAFAPLSGLEVGLFDADLSDFSALDWYSVSWVLVVLFTFGALAAAGLAYFFIRNWNRLRREPVGIIGNGLRVLPDGAVELGMVGIRPASLRGLKATGRGHMQSIRWKRFARHAEEREILVNILQTAERGLMIGHVILKVEGGHEAMFLEFPISKTGKQDALWVANESEIIQLGHAAVDAQLETVSSVLAPIAQRSGGLLTLTLTEFAEDDEEYAEDDEEFADDDAEYVEDDAASEAMEDEEAEPIADSATDSLQAKANEQLAAGILPDSLANLAGIISKYGYKLVPNLEAERLRGW